MKSKGKLELFPTFQVRVVRFYISCPASPSEGRTSTASARSQCSPPDPNSKQRIRVFPAGPLTQAPDQSVPRQNSTASSGSECSEPDLNHKEFPKICQVECRKECPKTCQIQMPESVSARMPDKVREEMPERMSE